MTALWTETNPRARITDEKIAKFVETMRSNVLAGDTPFRRAYIRSVIDQVEVDDDEIRIWGRKGVLEQLVAASGGSGPAGVPSFVRKWRARQNSNLWPLPLTRAPAVSVTTTRGSATKELRRRGHAGREEGRPPRPIVSAKQRD